MRRIGKLFGVLGAIGATTWLLRDRLISLTTAREPQMPTFRAEPEHPTEETGRADDPHQD